MDFLNKLYESNFFGIGLFAVISFLVVAFLVVLFFGKKDQKKRELEQTNQFNQNPNELNTFKETSLEQPINIPDESKEAVILNEPQIVSTPVASVAPVEPIAPVAPLPIENGNLPIEEEPLDNLVIEEPLKETVVSPVIMPEEPLKPIMEEPQFQNHFDEPIKPIRIEPTKIDLPLEPQPAPVIKEEPKPIVPPVEPVLREEPKPIVPPVVPVIKEEPKPIVPPVAPVLKEEPIIPATYYKPIEKPEPKEIEVPKIDFDALARSISKELDELEKDSYKKTEVEVSSLQDLEKPQPVRPNPPIDLPKKIDLPALKNDKIEPESYKL